MQNERILDVFPATADNHRLVIAVSDSGHFLLRQESFSSDVGWFVQSRVAIEAGQLLGLKAALTSGQLQAAEAQPQRDAAIVPFRIAAAS